MAGNCPLLFRQVDATVTRINTLFVMCGVVAFVMSGATAILYVLITDFLLRLYGYKYLSPINIASLWIQKKFKLPSKMEDAGAKRLAAIFGVGFMIAMAGFAHFAFAPGVSLAAGIYLLCAGLDLFFGYCIACKIYHISKKIYPRGFE